MKRVAVAFVVLAAQAYASNVTVYEVRRPHGARLRACSPYRCGSDRFSAPAAPHMFTSCAAAVQDRQPGRRHSMGRIGQEGVSSASTCACTQVRLLMVRRSRLLQTIYVRSSKNFVYRSEDEGRSWERQNWKMEKTSDDEKSGILSFHVSPSDTNKVRRRGRCCAQRRNRRASPATYIGWLVACAALLPWRGQTALGHARPRRQVHPARASVHDQGGQDPPDGARVDDGVASDGGLQRRRAQGVQHGGLPHPGCAAAPHLQRAPTLLLVWAIAAAALFGAPRGRARPRNRACPPGARHGARSPPWALPPRRRLAAGPAARHGALPDRRSPRRAPR